ncbi:hypothetical protein H257_04430 [Aphanomyces astaci]|uniref:Uncharacterized protein n=1 Tax=Aphanomyces astaci TaxID=112090 RepID=W4GXS0_APHAT|nr:hypothetical protein H257_04430 [Aphanomyces astaci]ETV83814.1 hypothetical protein H257_04430 [Aphanomyces astaci]|eukprot:XP_009827244.1 hypothetical protein H257_04430 [Aphanomyces astaci]
MARVLQHLQSQVENDLLHCRIARRCLHFGPAASAMYAAPLSSRLAGGIERCCIVFQNRRTRWLSVENHVDSTLVVYRFERRADKLSHAVDRAEMVSLCETTAELERAAVDLELDDRGTCPEHQLTQELEAIMLKKPWRTMVKADECSISVRMHRRDWPPSTDCGPAVGEHRERTITTGLMEATNARFSVRHVSHGLATGDYHVESYEPHPCPYRSSSSSSLHQVIIKLMYVITNNPKRTRGFTTVDHGDRYRRNVFPSFVPSIRQRPDQSRVEWDREAACPEMAEEEFHATFHGFSSLMEGFLGAAQD